MTRPETVRRLVAASGALLALAGAAVTRGSQAPRRGKPETSIGTIQIGTIPAAQFRCPAAERADIETDHKFWAAGQGKGGRDALLAIATSCPKASCATDEERTVVAVHLNGSPAGKHLETDCVAAPNLSLSTGRGLRLGDPLSRVKELYGEPDKKHLYGTPDKAGFRNTRLIYYGRVPRASVDPRKGTIPYGFAVFLKEGRVDVISLGSDEEGGESED